MAAKWLRCDDCGGRRRFILHAAQPRFIAEIVDDDDLSIDDLKLSYSVGDNQSLTRFEFWDAPPAEFARLDALLTRAMEVCIEWLAEEGEE